MITEKYFLLLLCWILYCLLHSLLATSVIKNRIRKYTGQYFKYYRIAYSIFATFSLTALLFFHFSFENRFIIESSGLTILAGVILICPGIILMSICIIKYFYDLSGIDVLLKKRPADMNLKVEGVHRYVRHPLYLGTMLLIWGIILLMPALHNLLAAIVITGYVFAGIYWEEKKLLKQFGDEYKTYAKEVPMLWPKLRPKHSDAIKKN